MEDRELGPQYPIRILYDDGECEFIDTQDDLFTKLYSIDSTDPQNRIWIRDDDDRTVRIRMHDGRLDVLEVVRE
jgi:hypothetical protein